MILCSIIGFALQNRKWNIITVNVEPTFSIQGSIGVTSLKLSTAFNDAKDTYSQLIRIY